MITSFSQNRIFAVLLTSTLCGSIMAADAFDHAQLTQSRIHADGRTELYALPAVQQSGEPVLMGYTDKPVPAGVEMPEALKDWLHDVQRATAYADAHPEALLGADALQTTPPTTIAPLLGDIEWDQGSPYSALCPSGCPVGCVATAMAQVMYYWGYPQQGSHSHSWSYNGKDHYVDFGATTYDWNLMYAKHHSTDSQESNDEVAKLSYHCGVSVDMMWESGGSGSYLERVPYALAHYFGYNPRVASTWRTDYTYDEWNQHLITELEAGRPILFSGTSEEGGHAFVIDGRNSRGYYHVNWGWDGYYNGYYDICVLNPTGTGTGATPSANGFSLNQTAIVNCCPEEVGDFISPIHFSSIFISDRDTTASVEGYMQNLWNDKVKARLGLEYRNVETGEASQQYGKTYTFGRLYSWGGQNSSYYNMQMDVKAGDLPDGRYNVYPCYQWLDHDSILMYPLHDYYTRKGLTINVTEGRFHVESIEDDSNFGLTCEVHTSIPDTTALGNPYPVQVTFTNPTTDRFAGYARFYFQKPNDWRNSKSSGETELVLEPGESKDLTVTLELDVEGEWYGSLVAGSYNLGQEWVCSPFDIVSAFTADSPGELYLTEAPVVLTERPEVGGTADIQFIIANKGGNFSSQIKLDVYKTKSGVGVSVDSFLQTAYLPMGCQGDTLIVAADLSNLKGKTKYYLIPYWVDAHGDSQRFTYESGTKVPSIELKVYEASGIEAVKPDEEAVAAPTFDLFGRPARQGRLLIRQGKIITPSR